MGDSSDPALWDTRNQPRHEAVTPCAEVAPADADRSRTSRTGEIWRAKGDFPQYRGLVPIVQFRNVDVFAFLDSDSDEAKTFLTYSGYVRALSELIIDEYGSPNPYPAIVASLNRNGRLSRLCSRRYSGEASPVASLLINSWLSELHLHLVDADDAGLVRIANHSAPVHAYYATTRSASAWLHVLNGTVPSTHAGCLEQVGWLLQASVALYPSPWVLACTAVKPAPAYSGFPREPQRCSNLSNAVPPLDRVAMCLRTTRDRHIKELVTETCRQQRRTRAPNGEFLRRDRTLRPTTVFDFLWRIRTRSNYGDPAMFYMGASDEGHIGIHHVRFRGNARKPSPSRSRRRRRSLYCTRSKRFNRRGSRPALTALGFAKRRRPK